MRRSVFVWFVVLCLLYPLFGGGETPTFHIFKGLIHIHSTFSDGMRSIPQIREEARSRKLDFVIITDHLEQIPQKEKIGDFFADDFGCERYREICRRATIPGKLLVVPGFEIEVRGEEYEFATAEKSERAYRSIHALGIGFPFADEDILKIGRSGIIHAPRLALFPGFGEFASYWKIPLIAAHPTLLVSLDLHEKGYLAEIARKLGLEIPKVRDYRYLHFTNLGFHAEQFGLAGYELFNSAGDRDIDHYLSLIGRGSHLAVTAGCDSHIVHPYDREDLDRNRRITYVATQTLTESGIIEAIRQGQTVATAHGVGIETLRPWPGRLPQRMEVPRVDCSLQFQSPTSRDHQVRLFRNGSAVDSTTIPKGTRTFRAALRDNNAPAGVHRYTLLIPHILVTSPITIERVLPPGDFEDFLPGILQLDILFGDRQLVFLSTRDGNLGLWVRLDYPKARERHGKFRKLFDMAGFEPWFTTDRSKRVLLMEKGTGRLVILQAHLVFEGFHVVDIAVKRFDTTLNVPLDSPWRPRLSPKYLYWRIPEGLQIYEHLIDLDGKIELTKVAAPQDLRLLSTQCNQFGGDDIVEVGATGEVLRYLGMATHNASPCDVSNTITYSFWIWWIIRGWEDLVRDTSIDKAFFFVDDFYDNRDIYLRVYFVGERTEYDQEGEGFRKRKVPIRELFSLRVTKDPAHDYDPAFDGNAVYFTSERTGRRRIWLTYLEQTTSFKNPYRQILDMVE